MLPIKKVLDLNTNLSSSLPNFQNSVAEAILFSLPYYDNNIDNVLLTFWHSIGTKSSGQIMSFEYFKKNYSNINEILVLIDDKKRNNTLISTTPIIPIKVLDIAEDYVYGQNMEYIAHSIMESLPEFDNSYDNIQLTFPYSVGVTSSAQILNFSYLAQKSEKFNEINQILKSKMQTNNIQFSYNQQTGTITESKSFGVTYISKTLEQFKYEKDMESYNSFLQEVYDSLDNLIQKLPVKISDIKKFEMYDYHGAIQDVISRPLLTLINKTNSSQILDFVLNKYPQFKDYYDLGSEYYISDNISRRILIQRDSTLWEQQLNNFTHDKRDEYLYIYYRNGIIDKNDSNIDFRTYYLNIFKEAIFKNDINFIKSELENPENVQLLLVHKDESETNEYNKKDIDNYPTRRCNNVEILKILKQHNFPFFTYNTQAYSYPKVIENCDVEKLFQSIISKDNSSDLELKNLGIIPLFQNSHQKSFYSHLKNFSEIFPDFTKTEIISTFAENILANIDGNDIPKLFKEFPSIDYTGIDVFSFLYKKYQTPLSTYALAVEAGADPRICKKFIEYIVKAREDGLKMIKSLNKEGIVVIKNPDYVFEIYNNKPTKNFTTYFDKCSDDIFSKYTAEGNLVWWGVETTEQIKSKLYRINDITQNSKDGRSLFHYFANKEHQNPHQLSFENIVKVIFGSHFKSDTQKFDLSYIYPNGNNLVHELLTFSTFKRSFNSSTFSILDKYSQDDLSQQFNQINHNGLTPIEVMINKYELDSKSIMNMSFILNDIVSHFGNRINYAHNCKNGKPLIDNIIPYLNDKDKIIIEDLYLQQSTPNNKDLLSKSSIRKF